MTPQKQGSVPRTAEIEALYSDLYAARLRVEAIADAVYRASQGVDDRLFGAAQHISAVLDPLAALCFERYQSEPRVDA